MHWARKMLLPELFQVLTFLVDFFQGLQGGFQLRRSNRSQKQLADHAIDRLGLARLAWRFSIAQLGPPTSIPGIGVVLWCLNADRTGRKALPRSARPGLAELSPAREGNASD